MMSEEPESAQRSLPNRARGSDPPVVSLGDHVQYPSAPERSREHRRHVALAVLAREEAKLQDGPGSYSVGKPPAVR
jgi:hypothetical protein